MSARTRSLQFTVYGQFLWLGLSLDTLASAPSDTRANSAVFLRFGRSSGLDALVPFQFAIRNPNKRLRQLRKLLVEESALHQYPIPCSGY
ncbi:unnamed protein product, partial [Nesidiocoris tenuis]